MIESEHTCIRSVPLCIAKSTPSACFCTLVTGFSGIHCAVVPRAVASATKIAMHHAIQPSRRTVLILSPNRVPAIEPARKGIEGREIQLKLVAVTATPRATLAFQSLGVNEFLASASTASRILLRQPARFDIRGPTYYMGRTLLGAGTAVASARSRIMRKQPASSRRSK